MVGGGLLVAAVGLVADVTGAAVGRLSTICRGHDPHDHGDGTGHGARHRVDHGIAAAFESGRRFGYERHHPADGRRPRRGHSRFDRGHFLPTRHRRQARRRCTCSPADVSAAKDSVGGAVGLAKSLPASVGTIVATAAKLQFVSGMRTALVIGAGVVLIAAIDRLVYLPARAEAMPVKPVQGPADGFASLTYAEAEGALEIDAVENDAGPGAQGGDPMTPAASTPVRPGRQRSQAADEAILSATLDLLSERGYGGFTVSAVIDRSGVSSATLYRRWPTKQQLVAAARGVDCPSADIHRHRDPPGRPEGLPGRLRRSRSRPGGRTSPRASPTKSSTTLSWRPRCGRSSSCPVLMSWESVLSRASAAGRAGQMPDD